MEEVCLERLGTEQDISRLILVSHAIKQRIDMLVEHSPQDTVKTWLLLGSFAHFSESLLLSPLLRDTHVWIIARCWSKSCVIGLILYR